MTSNNARLERDLPSAIYISSVHSLYEDRSSLLSGTGSAVISSLVTAAMSGSGWLYVCSALLAITGSARWLDMNAYRSGPQPNTREAARLWETRYIWGSCIFAVLLSAWCFLTFALSTDRALHLLSFAVCLGYMIGITGRNFSSDRLVTFTTLCAALPMIAALLLRLEGVYVILAALLVPFFFSVRTIAARLRNTLFNAVITSNDLEALAARFDTALNNMPHGLAMFDASHRLVVCNGQLEAMLASAAPPVSASNHPSDFLQRLMNVHRVPPASQRKATAALAAWLTTPDRALVVDVQGDLAFQLTLQPMAGGGFVLLVEDVTDKRKAQARIEHLARYDTLTGLPNRAHLEERFSALAETNRSFALLFVDLDQFKGVNDTLGHPCGDTLLCHVADRLCEVLDPSDVVARFGGDEFVILRPINNGAREASRIAQRILARLSDPFAVRGHNIRVGASLGIAMTAVGHADFDEMLRSADLALYAAKSAGRGVWRFFEPEMDERAQARRALETDMRDALDRGQFQAHFQPIVDLKSGEIATYEALARWCHPERGMISPAQFIPIAEESTLIVELGEFILNHACQLCASWPGGVHVAVNISPAQFRRSDVVKSVATALKRSGLAPHRLELEITESLLLENTRDTQKVLETLRSLGVRISLDDFGTGYASLSYLHTLPLDKVKIDRSFLQDVLVSERSRKLLIGVAQLSAALDMKVVVEGVETQEQLELLQRQPGIDEIQGFIFSPPMTATAAAHLLADGPFDLKNVA